MRYDALLRECMHSEGSLGNVLSGPLPGAIVVLGAGHAAVLQGWPLSAEGCWCSCGSHGRLFGVSNCFFLRNRLLETQSWRWRPLPRLAQSY